MEELNLTKEESEALYRIFCGLSSSCYDRAEVYAEAKPNMQLVYKKIIAWGKENKVDSRGRRRMNQTKHKSIALKDCLQRGRFTLLHY